MFFILNPCHIYKLINTLLIIIVLQRQTSQELLDSCLIWRVASAAAGRSRAAAFATAQVADPQLLVDDHPALSHCSDSAGDRLLSGTVVSARHVAGAVMNEASSDAIAERCVVAGVHQERVPPDVDERCHRVEMHLGRIQHQVAERLVQDPLGPRDLLRLVELAEMALELEILTDPSRQPLPQRVVDEVLLRHRARDLEGCGHAASPSFTTQHDCRAYVYFTTKELSCKLHIKPKLHHVVRLHGVGFALGANFAFVFGLEFGAGSYQVGVADD